MEWAEQRDGLPFTAPVEVTLPLPSTWISGPVQDTSKYVWMVIFASEGVKKRLLRGARSVVYWGERMAAKREGEVRRWGMAGYLLYAVSEWL